MVATGPCSSDVDAAGSDPVHLVANTAEASPRAGILYSLLVSGRNHHHNQPSHVATRSNLEPLAAGFCSSQALIDMRSKRRATITGQPAGSSSGNEASVSVAETVSSSATRRSTRRTSISGTATATRRIRRAARRRSAPVAHQHHAGQFAGQSDDVLMPPLEGEVMGHDGGHRQVAASHACTRAPLATIPASALQSVGLPVYSHTHNALPAYLTENHMLTSSGATSPMHSVDIHANQQQRMRQSEDYNATSTINPAEVTTTPVVDLTQSPVSAPHSPTHQPLHPHHTHLCLPSHLTSNIDTSTASHTYHHVSTSSLTNVSTVNIKHCHQKHDTDICSATSVCSSSDDKCKPPKKRSYADVLNNNNNSHGDMDNAPSAGVDSNMRSGLTAPGRGCVPTSYERLCGSKFRHNAMVNLSMMRRSPLPRLQWANADELWESMIRKEKLYQRDANMLNRHPQLEPRMRSILLDWLTEVCDVYRLHRETYFLAADFIDRYLMITHEVQKQQLQLIGISALFISAKLEEIYPPKLSEFAYVTDGACTESEILDQELILLKALKWDLSPMTVNSWLNVFLQLVNFEGVLDDSNDSDESPQKKHRELCEEESTAFVLPSYSAHAFVQIVRLLDLCILESTSLQFSYSILTTSALYHMSSAQIALSVSGHQWSDIAKCVEWMAPFALTLREEEPAKLKGIQQIHQSDVHNIQTHSVDLSILEKAQLRRSQCETPEKSSPTHCVDYSSAAMTPPPTGRNKMHPPTSNKTPESSPLSPTKVAYCDG